MLAVIFSETLAINVSSYNIQKGWREMLTIRMFRNAGDNNYDYNLWRAPQKI